MKEEKFSICRSKSTTKPRVICPDVIFYKCSICNKISFTISQGTSSICCNKEIQYIDPISIKDISENLIIDYRIIGGYNSNAVEVFWKSEKNTYIPEWIYLKTFTGGQLKYVFDTNKSSVLFALAEEDAYVYCDEDPCLECTFRCKRGFEIYAYFKLIGLIKVPLDKMKANW